MRLRNVLSVGLAGFGMLACAAAPASTSTTTTNEPSRPGWTGSLQPTQQRTGGVGVTGQTKAFGTVTITPSPGTLQRMHVTISVAVPTTTAQSLRWAVLSGRCGSGDLALIGYDAFPLIDISSNGRGQIETDLPLAMESGGTYHVNIYSGGQQLENVVTCANIRYNSGMPR
jgi:hypothetical protein